MKKKVIITGVHGFLGNRLMETLCADFNVFGIARNESINSVVPIFSSNKLDTINLEPDYLIVCHAAVSYGNVKQNSDILYDANVKLTTELVSKFNTSKIIYISTASIFYGNEVIINEKSLDSPSNGYSISKYWAEKIVLNTKRATVLRLSSLFGVGMSENTIIPNYTKQALSNNIIEVWGEGKRSQNYTHVDDVCCYIKKSIEAFELVKGKVLLAVHTEEYSNIALAKIISEATNSEIEYKNEDNAISLHYNNEETRRLLNWNPISDFKQEIQNYIKWKQKQF
jgi:nucleoside-diphosphate-sugar epimerase